MTDNSKDVMIKADKISKCYRIGLKNEIHGDFSVALFEFLKSPLKSYRKYRSLYKFDDDLYDEDESNNNSSNDILWALRDVSFEVKKGEVIGFIGKNGAGKSTLLKILSRITTPTKGRVEIRGKVSSLLEVGTGFHPELTGRENIYLNGTILGMTKKEVEKKFDEIVDFSGVARFIDTPVKRYSSGMTVRLAFSVAAHLEPDVLIIDEVLAVGDSEFQKKCLGKMQNVASEGRTVLFVSHNMAAVTSLCQKAILLSGGRIVEYGKTQEIVDKYLSASDEVSSIPLLERTDRGGTQTIKFTSYELRNNLGQPITHAYSGQDITIALNYVSKYQDTIRKANAYILVYGKFGESLFQLSSHINMGGFDTIPPNGAFLCRINQLPLQPGIYTFSLFCQVGKEDCDWVPYAGTFDIEAGDFFSSGRLPAPDKGQFLVEHSWSTE